MKLRGGIRAKIAVLLAGSIGSVALAAGPAMAASWTWSPTLHNAWYPNGTSSYWPTGDFGVPSITAHVEVCAAVIGAGTFYISVRKSGTGDLIQSSPNYNADDAYHCFTTSVNVNAHQSFYARIVTHSSMNEAWAYGGYYL